MCPNALPAALEANWRFRLPECLIKAVENEDFWKHNDGNEVSTLRKLAALEKLSASIVKTKYIDVGNPKGYEYAQSIFNR